MLSTLDEKVIKRMKLSLNVVHLKWMIYWRFAEYFQEHKFQEVNRHFGPIITILFCFKNEAKLR